MGAIFINSLEDLKEQLDHGYRMNEYLADGTSIFEVSDDDDINLGLIDSYDGEKDGILLIGKILTYLPKMVQESHQQTENNFIFIINKFKKILEALLLIYKSKAHDSYKESNH